MAKTGKTPTFDTATAAPDGPNDAALSRDSMREQLEAQIRAFIAEGGKIKQVPNNLRSDPPRKPETHYGSRPI